MTALHALMSEKRVGQAKLALKVAAALTTVSCALAGLQLLQARMRRADLAERIQLQTQTLQNLKSSVAAAPEPGEAQTPSIHSIAKLHTEVERAASAAGCSVGEFQANPDRAPYISVYTLDTNAKGWEQVSVHVTLNGSLSATLATVENLFKSEVPIEPDSLEITRQTVSAQGPSVILLRLEFRALTRVGDKA